MSKDNVIGKGRLVNILFYCGGNAFFTVMFVFHKFLFEGSAAKKIV